MAKNDPDLWFSFVRTHRALIREIERRLAAAKLPPYGWYDALWGLESGPDGTRRMHELADVLVIERYNLTRLIDRLESEGLVTRARAADDGRAAFATITDAGKVLRKKMWKIYQATVAEAFLAQFDAQAQRDMAAALDRAMLAARDMGQAAK
ncbi:DNA-binding MarR family transcriptional regulator [Luteibacter sp. Sphag1AF]|uniref:MarR family winged helix-turn-helix transcriptional regulator n=1 Tax=Luteibacter sp. Sphag1AF TaxID=2587031 RepID=UPI00161D767C|nr:MarR family winged helix-turn-helix transcriptional regulator [Luteibacter sp. Sphag1AF]MBB3228688.1 DNA-binding MarR family transcriptional regulator [Luteibacter sp. Sphag1AF]